MSVNAIGYNILNAMKKKGVTMVELSKRMQCDRKNLSYRILNPETMKVITLIRISRAIGVNWWDLMEGVDE